MNKIIIGVFDDRDDAESAINDLRAENIDESDISYIYDSESSVREEGGSKAGEGAASGAGAGAVVGGIAGLVVAAGIIPGLGALFVAGPLAAALGLGGAIGTTAAGAATGAIAGGLIGGLVGLGVKEEEAKVYEERVKSGGILVSAKTSDMEKAREIFDKYNADEVREYDVV